MLENYYLPKEDVWEENENPELAKQKILLILKEQKVSLSKTRCLFNNILEEIERKNPITL